MVLALPAKRLTRGEISAHLAEVYGADVSKRTLSGITDGVMGNVRPGRTGPWTGKGRVQPYGWPCQGSP